MNDKRNIAPLRSGFSDIVGNSDPPAPPISRLTLTRGDLLRLHIQVRTHELSESAR